MVTNGSKLNFHKSITKKNSDRGQTISSRNVSPNPSAESNNIYFTTTENINADVIVFNLLGEKMLTVPFEKSNTQSLNISVADLPDGIYSAKIMTDKNVSASK